MAKEVPGVNASDTEGQEGTQVPQNGKEPPKDEPAHEEQVSVHPFEEVHVPLQNHLASRRNCMSMHIHQELPGRAESLQNELVANEAG